MRALILLIGVLAVGCAGMKSNRMSDSEILQKVAEHNARVTDPGDKIVCERVPLTGSNLPELVCRSSRTAQIDRDTAQDYFRQHMINLQPGGQ
jgi:hypothetical protein